MAKVTIGGTEYTVPELNFIALERAWVLIEETLISVDPLKGASTGLGIIAAGLIESDSFDPKDFNVPMDLVINEDQVYSHVTHFLKKKLKASELGNIAPCVDQIIEESGLIADEGELKAARAAAMVTGSTATAPDTSSSSLPQE